MGRTSLADVDGDGDIDICSKSRNGDEHVYLRNMLNWSCAIEPDSGSIAGLTEPL